MQEIVVDTFVPNDAYIVGGAGNGIAVEPAEDDSEDEDSEAQGRYVKNSIVVCTGANACGKVSRSVNDLYTEFAQPCCRRACTSNR